MPKKTFIEVKKSGNDAIIQLKENQKKLLKNCEQIVLEQESLGEYTTKDTGQKAGTGKRGRDETRVIKIYPFKIISNSVSKEWEENIQEFALVERTIKRFNTKTKEWDESYEKSFYLSTKSFAAKEYMKIIRGHWAIENRNHYVKDVSMNEDASRIRKNADIFVRLRSFALNIMRANHVTNVKSELYENCLGLNLFLKKYKRFL